MLLDFFCCQDFCPDNLVKMPQPLQTTYLQYIMLPDFWNCRDFPTNPTKCLNANRSNTLKTTSSMLILSAVAIIGSHKTSDDQTSHIIFASTIHFKARDLAAPRMIIIIRTAVIEMQAAASLSEKLILSVGGTRRLRVLRAERKRADRAYSTQLQFQDLKSLYVFGACHLFWDGNGRHIILHFLALLGSLSYVIAAALKRHKV